MNSNFQPKSLEENIPGLYFYKDYFPSYCAIDYPCCLLSKIPLTISELSSLYEYRIPCQRCMLTELDTQYMKNGVLTDKFASHSIRGVIMKRRVIHYGYNYNYTSKVITRNECFDFESSPTLTNLRTLFNSNFNQALVNEYTSGQNISKHIDSDIFGDLIATISLGSSINYTMDKGCGTNPIKFKVNPGDLIILSGDARNVWRHGTGTNSTKNYRRVSITLRYANTQYLK